MLSMLTSSATVYGFGLRLDQTKDLIVFVVSPLRAHH